ncbi:MAG TPA: RdgB/HAM1 family non-canonical purine NTP pyrophosphatase [Salinivirga sp.]|uniref:RdgB/HAM1 family non-canonical purine NTP pyrophosphatase n=1 Tax=Salinivirga sp. TaxID=1970192 RepID=UPI002B4A07CE|nr:RdgB/HAM1 family non-canonical purine NTP pyrophosphatase [Salinivirga sp.]HKK60041.1 RdgB/HAM1 family non-canonical purine NTP pyrophosphatase [Salinivirga sp.]
MEVIFATHNKHKSKEIKKLASDVVLIRNLNDIGYETEIPETGTTLMANALEKCQFVKKSVSSPVFADDTGFEVDALNGAPGVYSARYAGEPKSDKANLQKLLGEIQGKADRRARFKTVICFLKDDEPLFFEGVVEGKVIDTPKGAEGFGYDPVFIPEGYQQTFAEMDLELKNKISHRGKAFEKFVNYLHENYSK